MKNIADDPSSSITNYAMGWRRHSKARGAPNSCCTLCYKGVHIWWPVEAGSTNFCLNCGVGFAIDNGPFLAYM
jgi:hypothetical protein